MKDRFIPNLSIDINFLFYGTDALEFPGISSRPNRAGVQALKWMPTWTEPCSPEVHPSLEAPSFPQQKEWSASKDKGFKIDFIAARLFFSLRHHGIEAPRKCCLDVYRARPQLSVGQLAASPAKTFLCKWSRPVPSIKCTISVIPFFNLLQRSLRWPARW